MLISAEARAYALLLGVLLLMAAYTAGHLVGKDQEHDRRVAEVATLKADHSAELASAEHAVRIRLQAAQVRGDALTAQLQQTESDLQRKSLETTREIKRLTTGRACLNAATVSVLNGTAATVATASVPSAASGPAATDGAAATDTDVAGWIDNAKRRFTVCSARLDALIEWNESPTGAAH